MGTVRARIGAGPPGRSPSSRSLTVGGALWVALRDLHRDAALGSLAELTVPYASQARQRFPLELLRPLSDDEPSAHRGLRAVPGEPPGRSAPPRPSTTFVQDRPRRRSMPPGISVLLVSDDRTIVRDPDTGAIGTVDPAPGVCEPRRRAASVQTGTAEIEGLGEVLYAATLDPRAAPRPRRAHARPRARGRLGALATADLVRALAVAALVLLARRHPAGRRPEPLGGRAAAPPGRRLGHGRRVACARRRCRPAGRRRWPRRAQPSTPWPPRSTPRAQAQRQLLADVRHDLRTPLTVIGGFAEALRDGTASGAAAERAADAIADEAGRLERMLSDLDHLTVPGPKARSCASEPLDARWTWRRQPWSASRARPRRAASRSPSPADGLERRIRPPDRGPRRARPHPRQHRRQRPRPRTVARRPHRRRGQRPSGRTSRPSAAPEAGRVAPACCSPSATTAPASPPQRCRTSSTASIAPTRRARPAAPASAWPSSATSPMRTAAGSSPRTPVDGGARVGVVCRSTDGRRGRP